MNRIRGYVLAGVVASVACGAAMPACSTNDKSIFMQAVLAPSSNRQGGQCVYTNDPAQPILSSGSLDIALSGSYSAAILFGNQLIPRGDQLAPRNEPNRVHLEGAVVSITEPDGALIREFTSLTSGFADVGTNNLPGYGATNLAIFDQPTADLITPSLPNRQASKTVIAKIKLFGRTLGNEDVESGEFAFPIQVCRGCLVDFSSGNNAEEGQPRNCLEPGDDTLRTLTTNPCIYGQDLATPCQLCQGIAACDPQVQSP